MKKTILCFACSSALLLGSCATQIKLNHIPKEKLTGFSKISIYPEMVFTTSDFFIPAPPGNTNTSVVGSIVYESTRASREKSISDAKITLNDKSLLLFKLAMKESLTKHIQNVPSLTKLLTDYKDKADVAIVCEITKYGVAQAVGWTCHTIFGAEAKIHLVENPPFTVSVLSNTFSIDDPANHKILWTSDVVTLSNDQINSVEGYKSGYAGNKAAVDATEEITQDPLKYERCVSASSDCLSSSIAKVLTVPSPQ